MTAAILAALAAGDLATTDRLAAEWVAAASAGTEYAPARADQRAVERAADSYGNGDEAWTPGVAALVQL